MFLLRAAALPPRQQRRDRCEATAEHGGLVGVHLVAQLRRDAPLQPRGRALAVVSVGIEAGGPGGVAVVLPEGAEDVAQLVAVREIAAAYLVEGQRQPRGLGGAAAFFAGAHGHVVGGRPG